MVVSDNSHVTDGGIGPPWRSLGQQKEPSRCEGKLGSGIPDKWWPRMIAMTSFALTRSVSPSTERIKRAMEISKHRLRAGCHSQQRSRASEGIEETIGSQDREDPDPS